MISDIDFNAWVQIPQGSSMGPLSEWSKESDSSFFLLVGYVVGVEIGLEAI